ncbi:MAG: putative porin [Flavobacteriaceae bacterium]|nr:putative porin [Flavobacteriaceae bacterium]MDG2275313.1 putative porin [Flavobacteriaceae bacterium]
MKRIIFFLFSAWLFTTSVVVYSQTPNPIKKLDKSKFKNERRNFSLNDSISSNSNRNNRSKKINLSAKTTYTDYKVFSFLKDTTFIDTTLNIKKHYKFNFLRKDNFGLLPFHNIGQTFNKLTYDFDKLNPVPNIGFTAKQFSFNTVEDINYYEVPTPTSEIMFLTTLEQGRFLDSFFTLNFSKRLNVSIAYTGLRSLGKYRAALVSQGNFRTTFHYETKKGQYKIRGHIATQDILHEESGGLTPEALRAFIDDDPNFSDRARLDVNLENTENFLEASRVYLEQKYQLLSSKDSANQKDFTNLKIGHVLESSREAYEFRQGSPTNFIGTTNFSGTIRDGVKNTFIKNQFFLEFNSKYVLGTFRVKSNIMNYSYGYDKIINQTSEITKRKLKGSAASFGADWKAKINKFQLDATGEITPGSARLAGTNLQGNLSYKKDSLFDLKASILLNSASPNFNYLLHQSSYDAYNWVNNFDNIRTQNLGFQISSKWLNAAVNLTNIENYTYFGEDNKPQQYSENVTYLKVKASREFSYKKIALDNTIMYQNVSGGSAVFRVPELITRNTLYYSDYWFKGKPMQVQIGATFNYFTAYKANAYNPLLAEFTLQNSEEIGFPSVDIFFNAQIRRTRLYFRIDNALSDVGNRNYFSAPNYPYRDFTIRFGLVWNWFI